MRRSTTLLLALTTALLFPAAASAGHVEKTVPFELDTWYDLEVTDGPVTLHRIRLDTKSTFDKSKLFRPGNSEYLRTVQLELEYTNHSSDDWEADLDVYWVDSQGRVIDGYHDEEDLDDDSRHDHATVTLSTLEYGLDQAKKLHIEITFGR